MKRRFIKISKHDFFTVISAAVRAHMDGDARIWYDEPSDVSIPAAIGAEPLEASKNKDGFILKQDVDWAIDIMTIKDEDWKEKGPDMIGKKVWEVGNQFLQWCDDRGMEIIITE